MNSVIAVVLVVPAVVFGLTCYDCFDTGPDHTECTKERTCQGLACMIFDAGDNQTSTAFCLLAMRGDEHVDEKTGCWLEADGKGKHCMCHSDFCNALVDRRGEKHDPLAPLLPNAEFLKQNPLIDYENPAVDSDSDEMGAVPAPDNVLFPSADKIDPKTAGSEDEDDLVAVDFEEYDNRQKEKEAIESNRVPISSAPQPPCWVLMFLTMSASWARFLMIF